MEDPTLNHADTLIVIGASAGGVDALKQVLSKVPTDLQAAIAIVLHSGPNSPRLLAEIWTQHSVLPVRYAVGGERLLKGQVYVAPPDQHLVVTEGPRLRLDDGPRVQYSRPSADRLFETAAQYYGQQTIGVVLTGGDGDGAQGMRAIFAAGGIGVVQEPSDAKDPSMPLTTLRTDHPRYCVPLRDIGELLGELAGARAALH